MQTRRSKSQPQTQAQAPAPDLTENTSGTSAQKRKANSKQTKKTKVTGLPPGITAEQLAIYNIIRSQLAAQKKAETAAQDEAIRSKNRRLMAEEEDGNEGSQEEDDDLEAPLPPTKKSRTGAIILDPEEMAFAGNMRPICSTTAAMSQYKDVDNESLNGEEIGQGQADYEQSEHGDADIDVDLDAAGESGEDSENEGVGFQDNGVSIFDTDESRSTTTSQRSRSSTPASFSRPKHSKKSKVSKSSKGSNKVTEGDFSPRTRRLAIAAKSHVRSAIVYHPNGPFASVHGRLPRMEFAWTTVKETARDSEDSAMKDAFKRASKDNTIKKELITFTMYGRTQFISSLITKAREKVRGFFGLMGTAEQVQEAVVWLLAESKYMYGDVNVQNRTYNDKKPFGTNLLVDIIDSVWFSSTSRSNIDGETTAKMAADRDIPLSIIFLILAVIGHSIREWENGKKAHRIPFAEDVAKNSYAHHQGNWNRIAAKAPAWVRYWKNNLMEKLLSNHDDFLDDPSQGKDLDGMNFEELNKIGEDWEKDASRGIGGDIGGDIGDVGLAAGGSSQSA